MPLCPSTLLCKFYLNIYAFPLREENKFHTYTKKAKIFNHILIYKMGI